MNMNIKVTPEIVRPGGRGMAKIRTETWVDGVPGDLMPALGRTLIEKIIDLEEKAVREALIALGWTPPPDPAVVVTR